MFPKLRWPSPALIVAVVAVVLALAGTAFGVSANLGQGVRITSQDLRITVGATGTRTLIASNEFGRFTVDAAACVNEGTPGFGAVIYLNDTDHEVEVMPNGILGQVVSPGGTLGFISAEDPPTVLLKTGTGANVSVAHVTIGFVRVTDSVGLVACDFVAQRTQL